jgi:hypothetical protein
MNYTAKKIKEIAELHLKRKKIRYLSVAEPRFEENITTATGEKLNAWIVAYDYKVFQDETAFVHIDDQTGEVIYILTNHGYIN